MTITEPNEITSRIAAASMERRGFSSEAFVRWHNQKEAEGTYNTLPLYLPCAAGLYRRAAWRRRVANIVKALLQTESLMNI